MPLQADRRVKIGGPSLLIHLPGAGHANFAKEG